jgi:L-asparaginase II
MNPVLLEVWRGNVLESVHRGRYAVARGRDVVATGGDADEVTFMRSCAKPFQAVAVLESGAREKYGLTDDELALVCGSHHGEDVHVRTAASILRKAGLRPAHLQCGAHMPFSAEAAKLLMRAGKSPTVLHNNCSGKHAGMVAAAKALKAPLKNYLDPSHALQRSNRRAVARFAGVPERSIRVAIDGCSAPTFGLPLTSMARAFARLADPFVADHEFDVPVAMFTHPHMVGHPCEELMRAVPREIVGKVGAEGVYGAGVVGHGLGIAVKVDDGAARPLLAVVVALLTKHAPFNAAKKDALAKLVKSDLKNHAGHVVGRYVAKV